MVYVIIEFHALNDMIAEPDADIGVGLNITRRRSGVAAHIDARNGVKPERKIHFIRGSPSDP